MAKKILVIDDDKVFSKTICDAILAKGQGKYEVTAVFDGKDGLLSAQKETPDLILCDLVMPIMGGIEFLKNLRAEKWGKYLTVIIVTQLSDVDKMGEGLGLGVRGYIVKSDYSIDEIVRQVEDVLK